MHWFVGVLLKKLRYKRVSIAWLFDRVASFFVLFVLLPCDVQIVPARASWMCESGHLQGMTYLVCMHNLSF